MAAPIHDHHLSGSADKIFRFTLNVSGNRKVHGFAACAGSLPGMFRQNRLELAATSIHLSDIETDKEARKRFGSIDKICQFIGNSVFIANEPRDTFILIVCGRIGRFGPKENVRLLSPNFSRSESGLRYDMKVIKPKYLAIGSGSRFAKYFIKHSGQFDPNHQNRSTFANHEALEAAMANLFIFVGNRDRSTSTAANGLISTVDEMLTPSLPGLVITGDDKVLATRDEHYWDI